jgi:hypothetical protein
MKLRDVCKIFYATDAEHTFFSAAKKNSPK